VTRFPGIHGGTTAVVSLKHDKTSQNGRISLVDSWKTGHSNDPSWPSIWPALKKNSRERAKVDTLVSCVFGMGEHGGSSMPFGWAGDAAWCATLSLYPTCIYLHWVRSAGGSPSVLASPDPPPRPRTSGGDKRGIRSRKGDKIANVSPGQRLPVKSGHFGSFQWRLHFKSDPCARIISVI